MIAMKSSSFMTVSTPPADEVVAEYRPARTGGYADIEYELPAVIRLYLLDEGKEVGGDMYLSIEHARVLGEALTQIVLLHDAAARLAAEKAVA